MQTVVRTRRARLGSAIFGYANLVPFVFFALFPFYFMLVTSLKSNAELYSLKSIPFWVQSGVIADHYTFLFRKTDFLTWMTNSLIISVVATAISLFLFPMLAMVVFLQLRYIRKE